MVIEGFRGESMDSGDFLFLLFGFYIYGFNGKDLRSGGLLNRFL